MIPKKGAGWFGKVLYNGIDFHKVVFTDESRFTLDGNDSNKQGCGVRVGVVESDFKVFRGIGVGVGVVKL